MHLSKDQCLDLALHTDAPESPHLAGCDACRGEVTRYRTLVDAIRLDKVQSQLPTAAIRAAYELFDRRSTADNPAVRFQRWLAELCFDSGAMLPATAGARNVTSDTRQLLFRTEAIDLDLSYTASRQPLTVRGQALSRSDDAVDTVALRPVQLRPAGGEVMTTCTDRLGAFHFNSVGDGDHILRIELEDGELEVRFEIVGAS